MNKTIQKYNWPDFDCDVQKIRDFLVNKKLENAIITGIPRGGLCLATSLSHALGIPYVNMSNCDLQAAHEDGRTLVVCEDIYDSGKTFERSIKYFQFWDWKAIIFIFLHAKDKWNFVENGFNVLNKCKVYVAHTGVEEEVYISYAWEYKPWRDL